MQVVRGQLHTHDWLPQFSWGRVSFQTTLLLIWLCSCIFPVFTKITLKHSQGKKSAFVSGKRVKRWDSVFKVIHFLTLVIQTGITHVKVIKSHASRKKSLFPTDSSGYMIYWTDVSVSNTAVHRAVAWWIYFVPWRGNHHSFGLCYSQATLA